MRRLIILALMITLLMSAPLKVLGLSSSQTDVFNLGIRYFNTDDSVNGSADCLVLGSGTLPSQVPEPYNTIFTAAANKFGVPPAFLAALFYAGEHGSSWPNPPSPYGSGSAWASSGVPSPGSPDWPSQPPGPGAAGPFQFEYPTWQKLGVDGSGDGNTDVEDLRDASFGAAKYLASLGAANTTDENTLRKAAADYNGIGDPSASYPTNVWNAYVSFSTGGVGTSGGASNADTSTCQTSGVSNGNCAGGGNYSALVSAGANFAGVDQGIDFTPKSSAGFDICAPASGTITQADQTGHQFQRTTGQAQIIEKLDQSPNAPNSTQYIYYAEIIQINSGITVGAHVNNGDVIGHNNLSPGIEVGWAKDSLNGFACSLGSSLGSSTPCGESFNSWVQGISSGNSP